MTKLKEYWALIVIVLILLAGGFYWYEWRPMKMIKECNNKAVNEAKDKPAEAVVNFYEFSYKLCLRIKGSGIK